MEQGFRPLKAGKMHPNALMPLPSGAARLRPPCRAEPPLPRSASYPQAIVKRCNCKSEKAQQCSPLLVGWGLIRHSEFQPWFQHGFQEHVNDPHSEERRRLFRLIRLGVPAIGPGQFANSVMCAQKLKW